MAGGILFLHGASSAGKTTLAAAIQAVAPRLMLRLSFDTFRDHGGLPWGRVQAGELDWQGSRAAVFDGVHRASAGFARAGVEVIFEHILDAPRWEAELARLWAGLPVLRIGVHTAPEELVRREAARGDRAIGSALQDHATVHVGQTYDVEVDGQGDPALNARTILARWEELIRP